MSASKTAISKENKKTKETKKVEETKKTKENKKVEETNTETMENHSIWYGRLTKNPNDAKFFREFLNDLSKRFIDEEGVKDILSCYWGKTIEELDDLIKTQNKREKKVKDKFTPENLVKPTNAKNLFTKDFVIECKTKDIKFSLSGLSDAWKTLSETKKNKYIKAAQKEKEEYLKQYELSKNEAIKNGSLSADKPKGPTTAFFRYLADNRDVIKQQLIDAGETEDLNTKVPTKGGELWKALSTKAKEPYELAYKTEKDKYSVLLEEWKSKETSRLKKLDGKADDIKVEESGDKKVASTEVEVSEASEPVVEKASKAKSKKASGGETPIPEAEKPVKAKTEKSEKAPKSKKVEKVVAKKVNLTEDEDEDDEE
jgi:hypothetical protein